MNLKLNEEQVQKIKTKLTELQEDYSPEMVTRCKGEILELLLNEDFHLYSKDRLYMSDMERWFYESGLYGEIKSARNTAARNKRYQDKQNRD